MVSSILQAYRTGIFSHTQLAKEFNVGCPTVCKITLPDREKKNTERKKRLMMRGLGAYRQMPFPMCASKVIEKNWGHNRDIKRLK
jgi:hypothetical protein